MDLNKAFNVVDHDLLKSELIAYYFKGRKLTTLLVPGLN